ncbi:MAG: signal peptidase I [Lachnospiraceae bacterium]|nr:signal peptidase I [Lachnospiraceae bacterium]
MADFGFYHEDNENNRLRIIAGWIVDILAVIALALFLVTELGNPRTVSGRSMEPALEAGDTVLVNTMTYLLTDIDRYDVVLFVTDADSGHTSIKRVVGLPGETVWIDDGIVYIDDVALDDEDHLLEVSIAGLASSPINLGEDEYFLLGDNGNSSEDSRFANVGNVSRSQILDKVWFCVSPLESLGFVS